MEICISDVKQWMTSGNLMFNDDKTELSAIASKHLFKKAAVNTIRVGDYDVSKVSAVRNLGVWFDDQLTRAVHITKICSAVFYHLHNISRIRKYFSIVQLRLLSTLLLVAELTTGLSVIWLDSNSDHLAPLTHIIIITIIIILIIIIIIIIIIKKI